MAEKKEIKKSVKSEKATAPAAKEKLTVEQLLAQLKQAKASKDKEGARVIRRKLRVAGHTGGLGEKGGRPETKKASNKVAKPATKTPKK